MRADILIVGQGLAGTMLAWEFERAGIPFAMVDEGHAAAATAAAAGLVNPITGRRLVKSWRFETLAPMPRSTYRYVEEQQGIPLRRDMRLRRVFADDEERRLATDVKRRAALAPFIESADEAGWWIRGAAQVDLRALLEYSRRRWRNAGLLREDSVDAAAVAGQHGLVIDCRGRAGARASGFDFVPWEFSQGELLELEIAGLAQDVILNRRFWIVPVGERTALAGATHQPGVQEPVRSEDARAAMEKSVREIVAPGVSFRVVGHRAGVRVSVADRRPVVGRHPAAAPLGLVNGLGAKGVLWAPLLARAWAEHLATGRAFDAEIDVTRFWPPTTL